MTGERHTVLRGSSALLPIALLFVPKCPLCALPLFAAFGAALPSAPALDALVAATAAAWLLLLLRARAGAAALAAGLAGAALLVATRFVDLPAAAWAGAIGMAAVGWRVRSEKLQRRVAACGTAESCGLPAATGRHSR